MSLSYLLFNYCFIQTVAPYSFMISVLCGGKRDACTTAVTALTSNTACATATTASEIYTGTCRDLYDAIIDNCDATVSE